MKKIVIIFLFIALVVAMRFTFIPNLGIVKRELKADKLILQEMVITKEFLINFESPKITGSGGNFGNCPYTPSNTSEISTWIDRILVTTFQKYVVPFSDLNGKLLNYLQDNSIPYGKNNMMKGSNGSLEYVYINDFHDTSPINQTEISIIMNINKIYNINCLKTVRSVLLRFSLVKSVEEVYLIFSDPFFMMDDDFVRTYYSVRDCSMQKTVNLDTLVLILYQCSPRTSLCIELYFGNKGSCNKIKLLSIIPVPIGSRKKRQAVVGALAFTTGFVMSNIFEKFLGLGSYENSVDISKLSHNQQKMKDAILDLDNKILIFEDHVQQIIKHFDDNFCLLEDEIQTVNDGYMAYAIIREFIAKIEYLLESLNAGHFPITSNSYHHLIKMCVSVNVLPREHPVIVEDICKQILNYSGVHLQRISIIFDSTDNIYKFGVNVLTEVPKFRILNTTTYEIQSIPIYHSKEDGIFTYKNFELPKKTFLYRNLEYTADGHSCKVLDSIVYCVQYMHVLISLSPGCLNEELSKTCRGDIVNSPDSCMVRKYQNHILVSSMYTIQVLNLAQTLYDLTERGENLKYLEAGTHFWPLKEASAIRVICKDQYLDFKFDSDHVIQSEIIIKNVSLANVKIYHTETLNTNKTPIKLDLLELSDFQNHRLIVYVWCAAVTSVIILILFLMFLKIKKIKFNNKKASVLPFQVEPSIISIGNNSIEVIELFE